MNDPDVALIPVPLAMFTVPLLVKTPNVALIPVPLFKFTVPSLVNVALFVNSKLLTPRSKTRFAPSAT